MFKPINTVQPMSKNDYKKAAEALRLQLLNLQLALADNHRPAILILAGDDRSGRHETINTLMEWFDPRFVRVNAYRAHNASTEHRPFFWRFWRDLPAAGTFGIYLREWTSTSIVQFLNQEISDTKLHRRINYIRQFERALTEDGALMIKIWLHLSKEAHQQRVVQARDTAFFDPKDQLALHNYEQAINTIDQVLEQTHQPCAPWHIVQADDPWQRNIVVGQAIHRQLTHWLDAAKTISNTAPPPDAKNSNVLDTIDLNQVCSKKDYKHQLPELQQTLRAQMKRAWDQQRAVVCVFEGVDAAGKGGAIRRLVQGLDAGQYRIVPIAKPSDEEKARHYLWRFWRQIPSNGLMSIFDRSWYGRVLVERVEAFAQADEWQRAYAEINDFEQQLVDHGIILVKFWLHIDQQEQLKRFQAREQTPHKQYKITAEDYRNREQWPRYRQAINDMIRETDSSAAPWTLISAQDKKHARIAVFQTLIERLQHL